LPLAKRVNVSHPTSKHRAPNERGLAYGQALGQVKRRTRLQVASPQSLPRN